MAVNNARDFGHRPQRKFMTAIALAAILFGCRGPETDAAASTGSSTSCSNQREKWRRAGELGHHEAVVFLKVDAAGRFLPTLDTGATRHLGEPVDADRRAHYLQTLSSLNPEPLVVLQPTSDASCAVINEVRNELEENLDCASGRCGEWSDWTVFGVSGAAD